MVCSLMFYESASCERAYTLSACDTISSDLISDTILNDLNIEQEQEICGKKLI